MDPRIPTSLKDNFANQPINTESSTMKIVEYDSDDDDWEEVPDANVFDFNHYNPQLPDNIKISLENDSLKNLKQKMKKKFSYIRCRINHKRKEIQLNAHRTHLLLYIYRLQYLNSIVNNDMIRALVISSNVFHSCSDTKDFAEIFKCFKLNFKISIKKTNKIIENINEEIINIFRLKKITSSLILNLVMIAFIRCLGHKVRLCYMLYPVPIKPLDLLNKKTQFYRNQSEPICVMKYKINDNCCYWMEIFNQDKNKWISVDFVNEIFDNSLQISTKRKRKFKNLSYVLAINNEGYINDVSQKYVSNWFSYERIKNRIEGEWFEETLNLVKCPLNTTEEDADQIEFNKMLANVEFPKRYIDYKNHPLFVLKRDILKFQALYPPDLPPLGFLDNEPIYSRDCIFKLKSRESWLQEIRSVKPNEKPYKIIEWKKTKVFFTDEPQCKRLELFGEWQTEPYEPSVAMNGQVPRNSFGNVDLFKSCMLPKGTVVLKLSGIDRIAAKMHIDCAPAIVGFNKHKKGFHPIIDGFVVCQEFKEILIDAWKQEQNIYLKKIKEDQRKRIYSNWRRLFRSLINGYNLKIKYG